MNIKSVKGIYHLKACVLTVVVATLLLVSCTTFKAPAILDISDSKVVVQKALVIGLAENTATLSDVQKEADRGCGQYNKKAILLSEVCGFSLYTEFGVVCTSTNYLFSCKTK